jgi:hypothetical protein
MPRFYFDVRDGESFTRDDDGVEFAGLSALLKHAATADQLQARCRYS